MKVLIIGAHGKIGKIVADKMQASTRFTPAAFIRKSEQKAFFDAMVNAYRADDRTRWDESGIKPYYIAKHFADRELRRTSLDYTILRPVRLTDQEGCGKVTIKATPEGIQKTIPREDVATTILEVLDHPETIGKIMVMSTGEIPINEAILLP